MTSPNKISFPCFEKLKRAAKRINRPENHLKHLIKENGRFEKYSILGANLFFDFSRQRVDEKTMDSLFELAEEKKLKQHFSDMTAGKKVNIAESRAALHTALRNFLNDSITINGHNVLPDIQQVRNEIKTFSAKIRDGSLTGSTQKPFKFIVVIGIGGSYLGTEFISTSLSMFADKTIEIFYLSNVDIHLFWDIISKINPETTLWIVISKSYTTPETKANENLVREYLKSLNLDLSKHIVTVTSKGSPGDDTAVSNLKTFHMFDFVGGRFSVSSAVGGVPLSIYLGYDIFERFLKGAGEMDNHAQNESPDKNLPMIAALISFWNISILKYPAQAIIPYASPLSKLAPHIQQLCMESNGKSVTKDGKTLTDPAGYIVFGEPGTNAQHSFFQLAHQGNPFPIDFIGVVKPHYDKFQYQTNGITNHQELWANLISQPKALSTGKQDNNPAKCFEGNRPSSTILIEDISPENIGRLLAFYEAKTVFEAFLWDINPFDQFGVELGKTMASKVRKEIATKNTDHNYEFDNSDTIAKFYLDTLFSGKL
ncbi:MAG: glucose-6-phosphate isomerase [Desulfobacterales bacterium]|nr:glucose-6-phosphate isomerase [Desulfobacterales bacterium]